MTDTNVEIEDLELESEPVKRTGVYICVMCKADFEAQRKRGTPVRICNACRDILVSKGESFCTTCRTPKPIGDLMDKNPHRCKACHYEAMGKNPIQKCLQCGSEEILMKYSKVCKPCFTKNDMAQSKFCVRCMTPVKIDLFPAEGNVCIPCKSKKVIVKISPEMYRTMEKFIEDKQIKLPDHNADTIIAELLKRSK